MLSSEYLLGTSTGRLLVLSNNTLGQPERYALLFDPNRDCFFDISIRCPSLHLESLIKTEVKDVTTMKLMMMMPLLLEAAFVS